MRKWMMMTAIVAGLMVVTSFSAIAGVRDTSGATRTVNAHSHIAKTSAKKNGKHKHHGKHQGKHHGKHHGRRQRAS